MILKFKLVLTFDLLKVILRDIGQGAARLQGINDDIQTLNVGLTGS